MILGPDSFRRMPWANGLGTTLELLRIEASGTLFRLSRASVVADGAFSLLPGIDRNLTVLSGPGFDLTSPGRRLKARPLRPLAFAGDLPWQACAVTAPSDDFNVMTRRDALPRPRVRVLHPGQAITGPALFLYALGPAQVSGRSLPQGALFITRTRAILQAAGPVIAVAVTGLDEGQMRKIG